ncbi:outer membrane usher protein [Enterobacter hormaechei]|uniref:outer membrane usher protein n=1 Tax=Enterobacter hormaechei TaxID=158836 RepID=UPI000642F1C6|nr:outer membrane usher protein [Enterobacter hormaechei]ELD3466702.1 outer membrane usher protein [Enterobacter hormaechei]KLR19773.1 fimbrial assembly protein [Enterobacter hormaechei subsp. hormaechei]MBN4795898.1 outer membrane usher protein [Enterobacter hormaechei]MBN4820158.1 outer membrane usher protein [Enterobacter hormaechei]MDV5369234.1 outer membrane usher protein [Enterobacter hormaechei]
MLFRRSLLCLAICTALQTTAYAAEAPAAPSSESEEVEFNDQFLFNTGTSIDVSRFSRGNPVVPGTFKTQVTLNGQKKLLTDFTFKDNGTPRATPCFTAKLLLQAGVKEARLKEVTSEESFDDRAQESCLTLDKALPGSSWDYDPGTQELSLSVPQIYIDRRPGGYVDPSLWDDGITAGMLSYDLNAWHSEGSSGSEDTVYAGLKYGLNLGPWRLRSRGMLDWDQDDGTDYSSQEVYLQRDITALRAQMLVGDSYTRGETFNSFSLRGLRMYNDDRMLPGGISTYAPTIRGVANSNAKVTVTQGGNKIYESTVPPGAFEIDDLSTTGYGSDLIVTIEESDGSKRTFSVPYSSVSQMLRPGYSRWDIGVGELHDTGMRDKPRVGYLTGYYGLSSLFTGYAGMQYMDTGYWSGLLGLAMNTRIGAFALDVTHSDADVDGIGKLKGQSYRLSWSKLLEDTNTSFNVAAYRFSTEDFLTLNDAASLAEDVKYRDTERNPGDTGEDVYNHFQRMKNQVQLNVSQPVRVGEEDYGSLYATGSWQDYWTESSSSSQFSVGYNNSFWLGSYSVSLQRTYDEYGEKNDSIYLSLTIPLENLLGHNKRPGGFSTVSANMNSDFKDSTSFNTSANGNTDDYRFSYSVNTSTSRANSGDLNQIGGYGNYNSPYGPLSLSASASDDNSRQYSLSYSGGMLVHSGGITLAPGSIGDTDTLALVSAPGAKGAHLTVGDGVIGSSGYAIMPYLSAYRENTVGIDISQLESDVEVKSTSTVAVPRSGAVLRVDFETDQGRSLLLDLHRSDNSFIPLGADVLNEQGQSVGSVGQAGQAYVRGVEDSGTLRVVWGNEVNNACTVTYRITASAQKVGLTTMLTNQTCQMQ